MVSAHVGRGGNSRMRHDETDKSQSTGAVECNSHKESEARLGLCVAKKGGASCEGQGKGLNEV